MKRAVVVCRSIKRIRSSCAAAVGTSGAGAAMPMAAVHQQRIIAEARRYFSMGRPSAPLLAPSKRPAKKQSTSATTGTERASVNAAPRPTIGLRFSPKAAAAMSAVLETATGARSGHSVLTEMLTFNGVPSNTAALLSAAVVEQKKLADVTAQLFLEGERAKGSASSSHQQQSPVNALAVEQQTAALIAASADAILSSNSVDTLKATLRRVIAVLPTPLSTNGAASSTNTASLQPEHYIAGLMALSDLERAPLGDSGGSPTSDFGFHLMATACRHNEDTQPVWESFFALLGSQRVSSLTLDLWLRKYEDRMLEKIEVVKAMRLQEDLFGDADAGDDGAAATPAAAGGSTTASVPSSAFSMDGDFDLDAALFPEFEAAPEAADSVPPAAVPESESGDSDIANAAAEEEEQLPSAFREDLPTPLADGRVPLTPLIAKLAITTFVMDRNLHSAMRVMNECSAAQREVAADKQHAAMLRQRHAEAGRKYFSHAPTDEGDADADASCANASTPAVSLASLQRMNGSSSSSYSYSAPDPNAFSFQDHIEMLTTMCYTNRFNTHSMHGDGGFKRNALATITGRSDGTIATGSAAAAAGGDGEPDEKALREAARTAALLRMPWGHIVFLLPSLTLESGLTLVQLKAAFDEGQAAAADAAAAQKGTAAAAPSSSSSATAIPLFVWEALFRQMCALGRIEDAEMLFRQLLVLHVSDSRRVIKTLAAAVDGVNKEASAAAAAGIVHGANDLRLQASLAAAALAFTHFEKTTHNNFTMLTLLSKYLIGAYRHKNASSRDMDMATLLGFVVPHHGQAIEELSDAAVEAHTNYLTAIVQVEQLSSSSSPSSACSASSSAETRDIPSIDLNLAHNQIGEMVYNLYEVKRNSAVKAVFDVVVGSAESQNAKTMLFFEMADRGLLTMSEATGKVGGKKQRAPPASSSSSTAAIEIAGGGSAERSVRNAFSHFFGNSAAMRRLSRELPEIEDYSAVDEQLMVTAEADAQLRHEESSAIRAEYDDHQEAIAEERREESERRESERAKEYEDYLSKAVHDARKDTRRGSSGSRKNHHHHGRGGGGRNSADRKAMQGSSSPRWSERHREPSN